MTRGTSVKKSANRPNTSGVPCVDRQLFSLFGEVHVESVFFVNEVNELLGTDETGEDPSLMVYPPFLVLVLLESQLPILGIFLFYLHESVYPSSSTQPPFSPGFTPSLASRYSLDSVE